MRSIAATFVATLATTSLFAQATSSPTFDVVSIKRHIPEPGPMGLSSRVNQRPDGGFTMTNVRVRMNYDLMGSRRPPETTPPPDAGPTVFDALREQLGLKLESSRTNRDTLVIDRLERPSEN